jgi:hypothetical protein
VCISGQQSDLLTLLVFFLVSAALQKKCTNINNGIILVPYNKSRLKQAISVNRAVFFRLLDLFTDCPSSQYIQNTGIT